MYVVLLVRSGRLYVKCVASVRVKVISEPLNVPAMSSPTAVTSSETVSTTLLVLIATSVVADGVVIVTVGGVVSSAGVELPCLKRIAHSLPLSLEEPFMVIL